MLKITFISMVVILVGSGLISLGLFLSKNVKSFFIGLWGCILACLLGMIGSLSVLLSKETILPQTLWSFPLGKLQIGLDSLSAFFLFCICLISGLASLYALGYLRHDRGKTRLGIGIFLFNFLVLSMMGVVASQDAISFLIAWEIMTVSSFFLVAYENERVEARKASLIYLIASQIGVIPIFVLFALLARNSGNYRFESFLSLSLSDPTLATICFVLALLGFGTKAGFWFLHIWLPEAHPAAPTHVSSLMSGVMIKLGIYGIFRTLGFLGPPPPEWGISLMGIGVFSGVAGVLYALGQHDLKRLLAYHSIENIGIITLGMGLGLLGQSYGKPSIVFLGFSGSILHVLNHGLFKGLLFQGAGAILHATGVRNIEKMGGLVHKLPVTAGTFLIGSTAISGLPPLNGFVSEFLIFLASFYGILELQSYAAGACLISIFSLALIGGLATACFAKAFGIVFLGQSRSNLSKEILSIPWEMNVAMILGSVFCFFIGLWPKGILFLIKPPLEALSSIAVFPQEILGSLTQITRISFFFLAFTGFLAFLRFLWIRKREVRFEPTWGCGYPLPTPQMQYTASSFAQPLLKSFELVLFSKPKKLLPQGFFPSSGYFSSHLVDRSLEKFWAPLTSKTIQLFRRLKILQQGQLQSYLLYILLTLLFLLVWKIQ